MPYEPPIGRPPGPPTNAPPRTQPAGKPPIAQQEARRPYHTYTGWFQSCEWCYATLCALVAVTAVATMVVVKENS